MTLRYRIVHSDDSNYEYEVQKKGWFFWRSVAKYRNITAAEEDIKTTIRHYHTRPAGKVIKEYTDEDYLVDKLRGKA